jgi:hypothetical protein
MAQTVDTTGLQGCAHHDRGWVGFRSQISICLGGDGLRINQREGLIQLGLSIRHQFR